MTDSGVADLIQTLFIRYLAPQGLQLSGQTRISELLFFLKKYCILDNFISIEIWSYPGPISLSAPPHLPVLMSVSVAV